MNAKGNTGKGGGKTLVIVLAALAVFILAVLFITGKFPSAGRAASGQSAPIDAQANEEALEMAMGAALDEELSGIVSEISVRESGDKYSARVRVVAAGGFYFPDVIEQTAPVFFNTAEELGITADAFTVEEYSKGNTGDMENFINWRSKDGLTGTYTDDTGAEPVVETGVTLDRLREIVE